MSICPNPFQNKSPLLAVNWFRVVLDEGHIIRNPNAQMSKAVLALKAQRRWILSGMLIRTSCGFLHSLKSLSSASIFFVRVCQNSRGVQTTLMRPCRYSHPEQRERPMDAAGLPAPEALQCPRLVEQSDPEARYSGRQGWPGVSAPKR